ncbi:MAG TPA: M56 family metallopeptidase, partial [Pirellulales bacterium]|nr:M56 family metallopeptidase [Pirellulales bacterium]
AAQTRYLICYAALATMLALPIGTLLIARPGASPTSTSVAPDQSALVKTAAVALESVASYLPHRAAVDGRLQVPELTASAGAFLSAADSNRHWLSSPARSLLMAMVAAWGTGVVFLSCRMLGGYLVARRLAHRSVEPLDEEWHGRFRQLANRLGLHLPIEIWQSAYVEAPIVIGCFRPVVLVPIGIASGLSIAQMEAILAHELAHIRRYDFLLNAVQCLIETLLFYHPCAWWISSRIRAERENCCDDLAVIACGDALVYARALSRLEDLRNPARLALALTGGGLVRRIRRIIGQQRASDTVGGWLAGLLAVLAPLVVGGAWASGRAAHEQVVQVAASLPQGERPSNEGRIDEVPATPEKPVADAVTNADDSQQPIAAESSSVHFLMPSPPFGRRFSGPRGDPLQAMHDENGPERMVKVLVLGLPGDVYGEVYSRLQQILPNLGYVGSGAGDTATVYLAPVSDLDFFASRIDLGQVTAIDYDKREITVQADHARLPPPTRRQANVASDNPTGNGEASDVASLAERLIRHDHAAVADLIAWGPEAESTAVELLSNSDRRVRRDALRVLKNVAGRGSLPAAIQALADTDLANRDLAWQVICRLSDAVQDPRVIEAAAEGLTRDGEQAAKWLTSIGPAAESTVARYAQHEQANVRQQAAAVLKAIGTRSK